MQAERLIGIEPSGGRHENRKPVAKKGKARWYKSPKTLRHAVMVFFFVFMAHIAVEHQIKGGGPRGTPSVEAYCPFGGLETLYQFLTTGGFVRRIEMSAVILFFALVLLTLFASRGFCGWICPFGSLQEWLGMLGRKIFGKRYNPGGAADRALRYLKYAVLVVIIALTWHTGSLVFRDYDPFLAFFHFGQGMDELPWAYSILGIVLVGSLYVERFFCKYACPLGAVLGIIGKLGLTKIQRDARTCKDCNLCHQKCHAHVEFLTGSTIRSAECNQCMDCVVDCPRPAVLSMRGWKWRFSHPVFATVLVGGLFGLVFVSQLAGKWQTKPAVASFTNSAGKLDAGQIRGWMTLNDISSGYGIPLNDLYAALGLPARVSPNTRINRVRAEHKVEFEPERARDVVERMLAGEAPRTAALAAAQSRPRPQSQPPGEHQPRSGQGQGKKDGKAGGGGEEPEVRGYMTLNEVALKTGVPADFLLAQLGLKAAEVDPRAPLREWMHGKGKSINDVREAVKKYRERKRKK